MKCAARAVISVLMAVWAVAPANGQRGGFGGHVSRGFSGHSMGRSVGHSFGHIFGHHGAHWKGPVRAGGKDEEPPLAGAVMMYGKVAQMPNPGGVTVSAWRRLHREPIEGFRFRRRLGFFPRRNNFGFGYCGFSGFPERLFFPRDFDCFQGSFFLDPFFIGGFFPGPFGFSEFGEPVDSYDLSDAIDAAQMRDPGPGGEEAVQNGARGAGGGGAENIAAAAPGTKTERPVTLLQLIDGSMYGLTDYWVEGERLHYVTNYGGENSVPLERIDFGKTMQINADRGIKFELQPRPSRH